MYLKLDTEFKPFTYDEMVKPLLYYKEAYDKTEAEYSNLVQMTEKWADIANREKSPEAYEMYNRYSAALNNVVDDFSKGMTSSNRRALLGMKRDYSKNIEPIVKASEAMKEANALRDSKGPDAIFEVDRYESLDSFLHGQTANNRYQSREYLTKKAAAMSEAAMKEALKDPEFKKAMGDQYWQIVQHTGGSYEELVEAMKLAMADNPIAGNRFSEIRQKLLKESGYENYGERGKRAIVDAIDLGLYAGLDKPATTFQGNQGYLNPLQRKQMSLMGQSSGGGGGGRGGRGGYSWKSSKESSKDSDGGAYVVNNAALVPNADGSYNYLPASDYDTARSNGTAVSWSNLRNNYPTLGRAALDYLDGSNPDLYHFSVWKNTRTGKNVVQIDRKQPNISKGEGTQQRQNSENHNAF